ncbi:hypothetical protein C2W58_00482 [Bacillus pumilus]|uniref:Uncharacterized protein n=1 Tax=Bacillus pumilus TaxID=1408 RepID=A0AB34QVY8_BACPU|nr:hypothetical protein B4127_2003 [Bacillus pumilus]RAP17127.1 hypothetical protein C2W58_00482 [Bacillus pumilus]
MLNDQRPQVLLSGKNIRFVFLVYYTMIHIKKKFLFRMYLFTQ